MRIPLIAVLLLAGCASEVNTKMYGADGRQHHYLQCDAMQHCVRKAAEICQNGYEVINQEAGALFNHPANMTVACK